MEKCTYCVQRIERDAHRPPRIEGRTIARRRARDRLPAGLPDQRHRLRLAATTRSARSSQLHADARRYDLLHELGTRPRTAYLARVRNPNPELA